jgi:hypothetical protein
MEDSDWEKMSAPIVIVVPVRVIMMTSVVHDAPTESSRSEGGNQHD